MPVTEFFRVPDEFWIPGHSVTIDDRTAKTALNDLAILA
jgi:hypothetical protein